MAASVEDMGEVEEEMGLAGHDGPKTLLRTPSGPLGPWDPSRRSYLACLGGSLLANVVLLVVVIVLAGRGGGGTAAAQPAAAAPPGPAGGGAPPGPCLTKECIALADSVLAAMDPAVPPCADFFRHACGGWLAAHPIPPDKSRYTRFTEVYDRNQLLLRGLVEGGGDSVASRLYASCMDEDGIDAAGTGGVDALLRQAAAAVPAAGAAPLGAVGWATASLVLAQLRRDAGIDTFFGGGVGPDDKDSSRNGIFLGQGGLSLGSEEFYKDPDEPRVAALRTLIAGVHGLLNVTSDPGAAADRVVGFETELAALHAPKTFLRDPIKCYHPTTVAELTSEAPDFGWDWQGYLSKVYDWEGGHDVDSALFWWGNYSYIAAASALAANTDGRTVLDYIQWRVIASFLRHLPTPFLELRFAFNKVAVGVQEERSRWETCMGRVDGALGFALGELYVNAAFAGQAREDAVGMVEGIRAAFTSSLPDVSWMSQGTADAAKAKADAVVEKIGYPPWIMDATKVREWYQVFIDKSGGVPGNGSSYFNNIVAYRAYQENKDSFDLWRPVDRSRWHMSPSTVNAYYSPSTNQIVFPAGILQPPFWHEGWPAYYNYGGMAAVIGHELTHGFDDSGRKYDKEGNLVDGGWWDNASVDQYTERAQCIAAQYSAFDVPQAGKSVNGNLTLGENIADNGGIRVALKAYRTWAAAQSSPEPPLPALDFTPDQMFFISFAQKWCVNQRPESLQQSLLTDPHSPPQFRVLGTLQNSADFAAAFGCSAGDAYVPPQRCELW